MKEMRTSKGIHSKSNLANAACVQKVETMARQLDSIIHGNNRNTERFYEYLGLLKMKMNV